jgi:hypothetical protein
MNKEDVTSTDLGSTIAAWIIWLVLVIISGIPVFYFWVFGVAANGRSGLFGGLTKFDFASVAVPFFVAILSAILLIIKQTGWGILIALMIVPSTAIAVYFIF